MNVGDEAGSAAEPGAAPTDLLESIEAAGWCYGAINRSSSNRSDS